MKYNFDDNTTKLLQLTLKKFKVKISEEEFIDCAVKSFLTWINHYLSSYRHKRSMEFLASFISGSVDEEITNTLERIADQSKN